MMYTALSLMTNCKSPVVVVLRYAWQRASLHHHRSLIEFDTHSGSMEPGIYRGDLLLLSNNLPQTYRNGDITVYQVAGDAITIVHRVVQTHDGPESCVLSLTYPAFLFQNT